MRYRALAVDYDGTVAADGTVSPETAAALQRVRTSGRRVLLVTGRELPELRLTCSCIDVFDRIVAENGALLYRPRTRSEVPLAPPPPPEFAAALRARGVPRISEGRVIVAAWRPHESTVLDVIRELGLELEVIFNKEAVMVLPSGVNKGTGLRAALREIDISEAETVGVGDAENDHSFLNLCGCAVAVANAIPALKQRADVVTRAARGEGVQELIAALLETDLRDVEPRHAAGGAPVG